MKEFSMKKAETMNKRKSIKLSSLIFGLTYLGLG